MRRVFWTERLVQKVRDNELAITWGPLRPRKNPSANAPSLADAPYNQEFVIHDSATKNEIARCQRFVAADGITSAASKLPDPKEMIIGKVNYHLVGRGTECAHCKAGIPTTHNEPIVAL